MNKIKSELAPEYITIPDVESEQKTIDDAMNILYSRLKTPDFYITSPHDVRKYLTLKLAELEHEVFAVIFLDNRHGIIKYEEMFRGTIDGASVYPREVIKRALELNANSLVFAHNHPSGKSEISSADESITNRLVKCAALFDIKVLDHLIVGGNTITSFAEKGLI